MKTRPANDVEAERKRYSEDLMQVLKAENETFTPKEKRIMAVALLMASESLASCPSSSPCSPYLMTLGGSCYAVNLDDLRNVYESIAFKASRMWPWAEKAMKLFEDDQGNTVKTMETP